MEEAGYRNCVSVPNGAPPAVSSKDLPPEEKVYFMLNMLNLTFVCVCVCVCCVCQKMIQ